MATKKRALTVFELPGYVVSGLIFLTTLFVFIIGLSVAGVLVAFVMDVAQTKDAIRRNYPVIGAAPMPLMDNVGLLIRESLPMVDDILIKYDLNERVRLIASGKLITPADVAWALCTGADFVNSARGFMFSLGCIQALKCNKNTCPTGVTTHDKRLQRGLDPEDKAVRVASYCKNMVHEVEVIAHSCGVHEPRQLRRYHVRIVQDSGKSIPMDALYPYPVPAGRHGAAKAALLPDLVPGQA